MKTKQSNEETITPFSSKLHSSKVLPGSGNNS